MSDVKYLLIDGNYILFRNRAALSRGNTIEITEGGLLASFMLSINRIQKEVLPRMILIAWDKTPYFKMQAIESYKQDRIWDSDRIEQIRQEQKRDDLTLEQQMELMEQLSNSLVGDHNFKVGQNVKYSWIERSPKFGFLNLIKQGFEADDWGYFFSKWLVEKNETGYVATSDDDWQWVINNNCSWFNTRKSQFRPIFFEEQIETVNPLAKDLGISLFDYGNLLAVYYGNHNNVEADVDFQNQVSFDEFLKLYSEGKLEQTPLFKFFDALNVDKYYDIGKQHIEDVLDKVEPINSSAYWEFHREFDISLYPNVPKAMMNRLDSELYDKNNWLGILEEDGQ